MTGLRKFKQHPGSIECLVCYNGNAVIAVHGKDFVSLLMSNPDIGVATVAAEAGHAQPSTTLMIYTQQYKKRRESIRNQLSRELYEK